MNARFASQILALTLSVIPLTLGSARAAGITPTPMPAAVTWDTKAAARYLDDRQTWWMGWPHAQRDHDTACVSCHTAVPYAMARPALRQSLGEIAPSVPEQRMLAYIVKRVTLWDQVKPFYSDEDVAPKKTIESRGTEAVLNALVLARYDQEQGTLSGITRKALANMWALQLNETPSGPTPASSEAGSFNWLNFGNAPWESNESHYYGATLAALAVGLAPGNYSATPEIQPQLQKLAGYLSCEYASQPLVNRIVLLWAASRLPDRASSFLTPERRAALLSDIQSHQQSDGGWSLSTLGTWKRQDGSPLDSRSDGYATGLTVYALQQAGISTSTPEMQKAVAWLVTHQDAQQGLWPAWSLNKDRNVSTDIGRFMSDAATSYSVLALESVRH